MGIKDTVCDPFKKFWGYAILLAASTTLHDEKLWTISWRFARDFSRWRSCTGKGLVANKFLLLLHATAQLFLFLGTNPRDLIVHSRASHAPAQAGSLRAEPAIVLEPTSRNSRNKMAPSSSTRNLGKLSPGFDPMVALNHDVVWTNNCSCCYDAFLFLNEGIPQWNCTYLGHYRFVVKERKLAVLDSRAS